jgi:hypothetical protein
MLAQHGAFNWAFTYFAFVKSQQPNQKGWLSSKVNTKSSFCIIQSLFPHSGKVSAPTTIPCPPRESPPQELRRPLPWLLVGEARPSTSAGEHGEPWLACVGSPSWPSPSGGGRKMLVWHIESTRQEKLFQKPQCVTKRTFGLLTATFAKLLFKKSQHTTAFSKSHIPT